jgi:hypothetical protein
LWLGSRTFFDNEIQADSDTFFLPHAGKSGAGVGTPIVGGDAQNINPMFELPSSVMKSRVVLLKVHPLFVKVYWAQ